MKSFRRDLKLAIQAGDYRTAVLRDWRQLYAHSKMPLDYLHAVSFQRALGVPPKPRQIDKLKRLKEMPFIYRACLGLYGYEMRQLENLLDYRKSNVEPAVLPRYRHQIQRWRQCQPDWLAGLKQRLEDAESIAVVGNSPILKGQKLGASIDSADLVIRFNHFKSEHTARADIGEKLNLWVVAPGYDGPIPDDYDSILLSGPDMLWWQQNWAHLSQVTLDEANRRITADKDRTPVISTPLNIWRDLVRELEAPPSAGILTLELVRQLLLASENKNSVNKLQIYGFSFAPMATSQYHHAIPAHQAVTRHNWSAEQIYLQRVFSPYAQKHDSHSS